MANSVTVVWFERARPCHRAFIARGRKSKLPVHKDASVGMVAWFPVASVDAFRMATTVIVVWFAHVARCRRSFIVEGQRSKPPVLREDAAKMVDSCRSRKLADVEEERRRMEEAQWKEGC